MAVPQEGEEGGDADLSKSVVLVPSGGRKPQVVDLGTSEGFASLNVEAAAWQDEVRRRQDDADIHRWEQLVHTFRTQVTSLHHNVSAKLAETFSSGATWQRGGCCGRAKAVWMFGVQYAEDGDGDHVVGNLAIGGSAGSRSTCGTPEDFCEAWRQVSRMTYRQGFAPMYRMVRAAGSADERAKYIRLSSDAGWGCMIRVGQMLLAAALKRHEGLYEALPTRATSRRQRSAGRRALGCPSPAAEDRGQAPGCDERNVAVADIERKFLEDPRQDVSPFSIFAFIRAAYGKEVTRPLNRRGSGPPASASSSGGYALPVPTASEAHVSYPSMGTSSSMPPQQTVSAEVAAPPLPRRQLTEKKPGDWFGPTTVSETIAYLVERNEDIGNSLSVYLDADGVLYEDEVRSLGGGQLPGSAVPPPPPQGTVCEATPTSTKLEVAEAEAEPAEVQPTEEADSKEPEPAGGSVDGSSTGSRERCRASEEEGNSPNGDGEEESNEDCGGGRPPAHTLSDFQVLGNASPPLSPVQSTWSTPLLVPMAPTVSTLLSPPDKAEDDQLPCAATDAPADLSNSEQSSSGGDRDSADVELGSQGSVQKDASPKSPSDFRLLPEPACRMDQPETGRADTGTTQPAAAVEEQASASSELWPRGVLLLFPLQLGLEKHISEAHSSVVLRYFELSSSLGAMGGRPRMAHFFVGTRGRELLFVDPHVVQAAALLASTPTTSSDSRESRPGSDSATEAEINNASHSGRASNEASPQPRREAEAPFFSESTFLNTPMVQMMPVDHIDASISFAFYCRSEADLQTLLADLRRIDAREANAPIRAEPTRPAGLRPAAHTALQVLKSLRNGGPPPSLTSWPSGAGSPAGGRAPAMSWCDLDGLAAFTAEADGGQPTLQALQPESRWTVSLSDFAVDEEEDEEEDIAAVGEEQGPLGAEQEVDIEQDELDAGLIFHATDFPQLALASPQSDGSPPACSITVAQPWAVIEAPVVM
eukprot:TRINITY_DN5947_c0_g1_i1.p1 TRINITY_DN5947_c0_g1~~TRINITY_DN5947_c0_g1_i1.p1  ORF type:complete len:1008 (-),score=213.18 TRINITY_DN5947_c0_g1_i1:133-3090(-)